MMTFFKIVFCVLLCCPVVYVVINLFNNIVDDATRKR